MRILTEEGERLKREYERLGGCSCHLSPPCYSCMHPGHPISLDEQDDLWEEEHPAVDFSAITRSMCK